MNPKINDGDSYKAHSPEDLKQTLYRIQSARYMLCTSPRMKNQIPGGTGKQNASLQEKKQVCLMSFWLLSDLVSCTRPSGAPVSSLLHSARSAVPPQLHSDLYTTCERLTQ